MPYQSHSVKQNALSIKVSQTWLNHFSPPHTQHSTFLRKPWCPLAAQVCVELTGACVCFPLDRFVQFGQVHTDVGSQRLLNHWDHTNLFQVSEFFFYFGHDRVRESLWSWYGERLGVRFKLYLVFSLQLAKAFEQSGKQLLDPFYRIQWHYFYSGNQA